MIYEFYKFIYHNFWRLGSKIKAPAGWYLARTSVCFQDITLLSCTHGRTNLCPHLAGGGRE